VPAASPPLLECRDLRASYGAFQALKNVSLAFAERERVGIFGHNGCGKSTLLNCCVGAHRELSGAVSFAGQAVVPGEVHRNVKLGIGYVPQGRNVFKALSVERNLTIAGLMHQNEDLESVYRIFPVLRARRPQPAGTMSGGEQQMIAFGMALMTRPRILLLDEPTTGLSPVLANMVLETVARINRELAIGIVLVEQNVSRTLKAIDRAVIMKMGRVISDGPAVELADKKHLWAWF